MIRYSEAYNQAWELYKFLFKNPNNDQSGNIRFNYDKTALSARLQNQSWQELCAIMDIPKNTPMSKFDHKVIVRVLTAFGKKELLAMIIKERGIKVGDTVFLRGMKGKVEKIHDSGFVTISTEDGTQRVYGFQALQKY